MGCAPSNHVKLSVQPYAYKHHYVLRICGYTNSLYQTASSAVLYFEGHSIASDSIAHEDEKNATVVAYMIGLDMAQTHTLNMKLLIESHDMEFLNLVESDRFHSNPYYKSIVALEHKFVKIEYNQIASKHNMTAIRLCRDAIYFKSLEENRKKELNIM